jgi:predicted O-methyltransferase YrrM
MVANKPWWPGARTAVASKLPPRLRGRLGASLSARESMGFNDQDRRAEMMLELVHALKPELVIETGTYQGATTEWFADNTDAEIVTVESSEWFFSYAQYRLSQIPRIEVLFSDSVKALKKLSSDPRRTSARTLFYLDAHWNDYLPLADEVALMVDNWPDFVAVIDDFEVDDDPGYTFDDYGPGKRLDKSLIPSRLHDSLVAFYPSAASGFETSHKRGAIVLAPKDKRPMLATLSGLRQTSLSVGGV